MNVTVVSYDRQLDVGIVGDRELMPDVWELMDDLTAELQALVAVAAGGADPVARSEGASH